MAVARLTPQRPPIQVRLVSGEVEELSLGQAKDLRRELSLAIEAAEPSKWDSTQ